MTPLIPENAPFTPEQRAWLNGFLAAWLAGGEADPVVAGSPAASGVSPLILFGSQSGNAESLAKKAAKAAQARGLAARVREMNAVDPATLAAESHVLVVTSTWGEGEMPDNAKEFWEKINNGHAPTLKETFFSVLALGDRNYGDTFCWAGRQIDQRLEQLGGSRLLPRVECDVDFDQSAAQWMDQVLEAMGNTGAAPRSPARLPPPESSPDAGGSVGFGRKNPFPAPLVAKHCLNKSGSAKDVWHVEFSLEGSGLAYEAGDALGVFPRNDPDLVDGLLARLGWKANEAVPLPDSGEAPLRDALLDHYECRKWFGSSDRPAESAAEWVASLKRLSPRLYSISSSPKAHPGRVHLTVGAVRYEADGKTHTGVCSTFLADRLAVGGTVGVFVQTSRHFRPPADPTRPMIMVGPGTGIAPFRAFLEERQATGATGKNWLFFGDQKASSDFLYEEQMLQLKQDGILTRLDTAFSRDQAEKVYVQHRMLAAAAELWAWLEEGAHFYVCGDASRMAKDVDAALHQIARDQGGKSGEDAAAYVAQLKADHRYQRDVY